MGKSTPQFCLLFFKTIILFFILKQSFLFFVAQFAILCLLIDIKLKKNFHVYVMEQCVIVVAVIFQFLMIIVTLITP